MQTWCDAKCARASSLAPCEQAAVQAVMLLKVDAVSQQRAVLQLNGTIPPWGTDGGLSGLQFVALDNNMLSGSLPQTLSK